MSKRYEKLRDAPVEIRRRYNARFVVRSKQEILSVRLALHETGIVDKEEGSFDWERVRKVGRRRLCENQAGRESEC